MKVLSSQYTIVLSRRNLLSLLAKLDGHPKGSACTLFRQGWGIRAEEDEKHYKSRPYAPGPMHPETEAHIRRGNN